LKKKYMNNMNQNKKCLIFQPAGIGDIMFCQYICKQYVQKGYNVIYPLKSSLMYLKEYISNPGVTFIDIESNFEGKQYLNKSIDSIFTDDFVFLNLDQSQRQINTDETTMHSKYSLVNLDFKKWADGFELIRNKEREDWLYYDLLKLKDDSIYSVKNNKYGTPPDTHYFPLPELESDIDLQDMPFIEGTNIMDWCKVLENAKGIVTVDTCILYIMTKLKVKYEYYYLFCRPGWSYKNYIDITPFKWDVLN